MTEEGGGNEVALAIMSQLLAGRHHVATAKAVQTMATALDRVAGDDAIERLIDVLFALSLDDEHAEIQGRAVAQLREIQEAVAAVVSTAAVAVRAAEERHGGQP